MNYLITYRQTSNSKNALHNDIDVLLKKYNRITVFDSDLLDFTNYIREQVEFYTIKINVVNRLHSIFMTLESADLKMILRFI